MKLASNEIYLEERKILQVSVATHVIQPYDY